MSEPKYKAQILQTIDHLRKRKARPDLERICHILKRKHGLNSDAIKEDLIKLVIEKSVIKVDYKGSVSYRNAAKWRKRGSFHNSDSPRKPNDDKEQLFEADEDMYSDDEKLFDAVCADMGDIKNDIGLDENEDSLNVEAQDVTETNEGFHDSDPVPKLDEQKPKPRLKPGPKPKAKHLLGVHNIHIKDAHKREKTPSPGKRGRGPKRKRIHKTHGPDFESYGLPHKLQRRHSNEERTGDAVTSTRTSSISLSNRDRCCDFCLLSAERNPSGQPEELLICKDCQAKAHPSCMEYSEELARRARNSPWQCIDCKTCFICQDAGDAGAMLFCDACDKGYHMECHAPPITEQPTGTWVCSQCELSNLDNTESVDTHMMVNGSVNGGGVSPLPSIPTPRESPVSFTDRLFHPPPAVSMNTNFQGPFVMSLPSFRRFRDEKVPDASTWSVEEVVKFISDAGFERESDTFREQEIDGKSLLLMKRSDVLQGLSLKLGPALKIYAHIQRLQTKGSVII